MQSHMTILIAYCIGMIKDHQTLFNFAILAGKRQKRTFSCKKLTFLYKVALKFFMVGPKRGPLHHGPPPKYATGFNMDI